MQLVGLTSDEVRLPLVPASESTRAKLRSALAGLGVKLSA